MLFLYALSLAKEMDAEIYVMNTYMQPVLSATHAGQPEMVPEVYENYELHRFESFKNTLRNCVIWRISRIDLIFP